MSMLAELIAAMGDATVRTPIGAGRYEVFIRENSTGRVVQIAPFDPDCPWDNGPAGGWAWGNFSCDCNRRTAFLEATGEMTWDEACDREDADEEQGISWCGHEAFDAWGWLSDGSLIDCNKDRQYGPPLPLRDE